MQWLRFDLNEPDQIFFKESNNKDVLFYCIDIKKRNTDTFLGNLPLLYPTGREIEAAKYSNLQDLLPYIPPYLHTFYNNLKFKGTNGPNDDEDYENVLFSVEGTQQFQIQTSQEDPSPSQTEDSQQGPSSKKKCVKSGKMDIKKRSTKKQ